MMNRGWIAVAALLVAVGQAQSGWFDFGRSASGPDVDRLYVAGAEAARGRETVTFFRDHLEAGRLVVKGFAARSKVPVALAEVSLDGGETWAKADLSKRGFEYAFAPEPGRSYTIMARLTDAGGKQSLPEETPSMKAGFRDEDLAQAVRAALNKLAAAYRVADLTGFMDGVSLDYRGWRSALEDAVARDLQRYNNIALDIIEDGVVAAGRDAKLTFRFHWRGYDAQSGAEIRSAQETTVFTFRWEDGRLKLLEMAYPPMFGLSRASDITTGSSGAALADASVFEAQDESAGFPWTSVTLKADAGASPYTEGFTFATGQAKRSSAFGDVEDMDLLFDMNIFKFRTDGGGGVLLVGSETVPETGYAAWSSELISVGQRYAVKTQDGFFAIFEVMGYAVSGDLATLDLRYKYRADGGRTF